MSKHLARIAKVDNILSIPNADNIQTAIVFGFETIVSKNTMVGDIGVFFEAGDTQLLPDYIKNNNLYRHSALNLDQTKSGYIEDNGKLKVQKFLKVKSEGLFMPLSSLEFTGYDIVSLKVGDAFDILCGINICQKWINYQTRIASGRLGSNKKIKNVQTPLFHEHCDTEQLAYYIDSIPIGSLINISAKWHGTSHRVAYTNTIRKTQVPKYSSQYIRSMNKVVQSVRYTDVDVDDYEYIAGSRRVVLLSDQIQKEGFHGPETWRFDILDQFKPYLEKNMTVYMEVVGYVNGAPIMGVHDLTKLKDERFIKKYGKQCVYKYGCNENEYKIYVYRITLTNPDGIDIDFTPIQLEKWCNYRNFLCAKPLIDPFFYDGDAEKLMKLVKNLTEREDVLTEDYEDSSHINEGVIIRCDYNKLIPSFYKVKSFAFKVMEGIIKENPSFVDIEDAS